MAAKCGWVGRRFGLKKQKDRPKAAEIMSTTPILPHLFLRCRIVGGVSAGFFRTPTPRGGWATSGALGVDTRRQLTGNCDRSCHAIVEPAEVGVGAGLVDNQLDRLAAGDRPSVEDIPGGRRGVRCHIQVGETNGLSG